MKTTKQRDYFFIFLSLHPKYHVDFTVNCFVSWTNIWSSPNSSAKSLIISKQYFTILSPGGKGITGRHFSLHFTVFFLDVLFLNAVQEPRALSSSMLILDLDFWTQIGRTEFIIAYAISLCKTISRRVELAYLSSKSGKGRIISFYFGIL